LLKIPVPVSVNLAVKKETVQEVVELVPGSIIKFEKGCDELLHMVVGGQTIAEGEAVKIGDKFGFRVTAMVMPEEHFIPVQRPRPV
jgi:flagellar motor switch/type III secretory pathway protein FliN